MTTIQQLAGITAQHNEIVKRVGNGSLDPTAVKRALQNIIEGNLSSVLNWNPPIWWRTPEHQLEKARQLWPDAVLPDSPKEFAPRTSSEVLLLHVPESFGELWDKVDMFSGYSTRRWPGVRAVGRMHLIQKENGQRLPVWIAFDPEHGSGKAPESLWGQSNLAGSEVLSALIQFPGWPFTWVDGASAPNISGYWMTFGSDRVHVPCVNLRGETRNELTLSSNWADAARATWASPSVRKC